MSKSCSQMASSSSRRGKKVAHLLRNASPKGWISDDEERYKFGCYRKLFKVVPHKFLDVELFRREGFIFQEWLVDVGLLKFVEMTVALRHNGLKKTKHGWVFKDVDETPSTFTPQTEFERFVVDQFQMLSTRISKVEKSLIMIHKKSDEDNAPITPSTSESDDDDNTTEVESMETSDSD
ncbi:uncharacterized protein HKW66_Vig0000190 [Vigna angularis]|uniref:Uncharacterized protein n=1 Tax=Phaseolus angularis TaxID=3914 RepID=A0A8T0LBK3_PHAAN|nr:uncharacterized protein HKW66_Vig0000190 [Vigna angularis]